MAQLYVGEQFWTDNDHYVTASSPKGDYRSRTEFIQEVNAWMDRHKITYRWSGESTHEHNYSITYQYHVKIADQKQRTFFALKWS